MQPKPIQINQYLYYGYLPPLVFPSWLDDCFNYFPDGYEYTAKDAGRLLDVVMDESLTGVYQDGYYVIPISGGWDSRIVLGAALKRFETSQIKTMSFGIPGQLDFDIGHLVARVMEVEHHAVDLSRVLITWDQLIDSVVESPWTSVPDSFFHRLSLKQVAGTNDLILSGFMGDAISGKNFSKAASTEEAIKWFLARYRAAKSVLLTPHGYNIKKSIPSLPNNSLISPSELLDYGIHQANCFAPNVTPLKRLVSWGSHLGQFPAIKADFIAPYIHPKWVAYWLKSPKEAKKGQKLYLEMIANKFPKLACLPGKNSFGAKVTSGIQYLSRRFFIRAKNRLNNIMPKFNCGSPALLNYLDYDAAFRKREDYKEILKKAINYLLKNNIAPWIDFNLLQQQHMSYRANHGNAFLVLIGLALNLANDDQKILTSALLSV